MGKRFQPPEVHATKLAASTAQPMLFAQRQLQNAYDLNDEDTIAQWLSVIAIFRQRGIKQ